MNAIVIKKVAIAGIFSFLALPGTAAEFFPIAGITTSTSGDLWPVSNLIEGPDNGYDSSEPYSQIGSGGDSRWVTNAPGGFPSDFIDETGKPVLVIDLGAGRPLSEISVWGYSTTNANGVSEFSLRFASSAEGASGFATSITYNPSFNPAIDDTSRQSFVFSETVIARYVEFTCDDNFYTNGGMGPPAGGDRVGLGEIAFEDNVPNPNPVIEVAGGIDLGNHPEAPGVVLKTLTIANLGTDLALEISSATLQPGSPGADYFSVSGAPLTIASGQDAQLTITLDAGGNEGCFNAILDLVTNDPERPLVSVIVLAGINCAPQQPEEPAYSHDSGTFSGSFELTLSTPTPASIIVYTTDGSVPSEENGMTYTDPISIDSSMQVRAATISGDFPPAIATENYVRLAADVQSYSSPLPILIVENYGAGTVPNKGWSTSSQTGAGLQQPERQSAYLQIIDRYPDTDTSSIVSMPDHTSRIGIRVRGAFSSTWNPKPYAVEAWKKDSDEDRDISPLGMPSESDWILYYAHPNYDRTMLYNTFIWELARQTGRYGNRFRFVDVFVNEDGGDLKMSDRRGVYAFAEKVKRGGERIDFEALSDDGTTGGWLLGINRMDPIPPGGFPAENGATSPQFFHTAGPNGIQQTSPNVAGQGDDIPRQYNAYINFESPNGYRINQVQRAAIENWFAEFEDVFYDDDLWRDPVNGYRKYLNTRDFIDYFHLLNLAKQGDGLLISVFPWVSSGERKLHMGPLWDFNNGAYGSNTNSPLYFRKDRLWYPRLFQDPDYQREYEDRWYELRRGPLSAVNMESIIDRQSAEITTGLAASQGASGWSGRLSTMKANLRNRAAWLDSQFFAPPAFNRSGNTLTITNTSGSPGTIFYTTDGTDPLPPDGVNTVETILLDQGAAASALIPSIENGGANLSLTDWAMTIAPPDPGNWLTGSSGIGFDYDGLIGLDVEAMKGDNASVFVRIPFSVADQESLDAWNALTLRMKFEDGFVAYINGVRVAEFQAPSSLLWDSAATSFHSDSKAVNFIDFDISVHLGELQVGSNMLAIHALNQSVGSSDLLVLPQLVASAISVSTPGARVYTAPLDLDASATVRARILDDNGEWSAYNEATLVTGTPATASNLAVSEIMYHPSDQDVAAEFIEVQNISETETIDLTQVVFTGGIDYHFPVGATLSPGELFAVRGVDFENSTRLANGGEQIVITAADGSTVRDFTYNDKAPWPSAADGEGFSLVLIAPLSDPDHNDPANWRRSSRPGGSPAGSDISPFPVAPAEDNDGDGFNALTEHFFGTSDGSPASQPDFSVMFDESDALQVQLRRDAGAEGVGFAFETSTDLANWLQVDSATIVGLKNGDSGFPSEAWLIDPAPQGQRQFIRIRVQQQ